MGTESVAAPRTLLQYMEELNKLDERHQELLKKKNKHVQANIVLCDIIAIHKEIIARWPEMKPALVRI
jgi:hypothetical protein